MRCFHDPHVDFVQYCLSSDWPTKQFLHVLLGVGHSGAGHHKAWVRVVAALTQPAKPPQDKGSVTSKHSPAQQASSAIRQCGLKAPDSCLLSLRHLTAMCTMLCGCCPLVDGIAINQGPIRTTEQCAVLIQLCSDSGLGTQRVRCMGAVEAYP